jgi:hypothetical protein
MAPVIRGLLVKDDRIILRWIDLRLYLLISLFSAVAID